ncbi:MAG: oxygen-dependent coproporphyrinogen oxidase [Acidobacteriota bacterium]
MKERAEEFFSGLQDRICKALEEADGGARFREDNWVREGGGGGRTRVIENGTLFEKAGVNFSSVYGELPEAFASRIELGDGRSFYATGISLVLHPRNPHVPTVHANLRYLEKGNVAWFGGGTDLTPYYPVREDVIHFHSTLRSVCDRHDAGYYGRFKKWCDEYFFIKHRGETRGVGGIFFDYLKENIDSHFDFVRDLGGSFPEAYLPIVARRRDREYTTEERDFQLIRRGRYAEFNLIYDRGTTFGLETGGRTESILMSMPPLARWAYDFQPQPGSAEADACSYFRPQDWLS